MISMAKYGICYVGINQTADDNAIRSAMSVRLHMPDIPITFFTDQGHVYHPVFEKVVSIMPRLDEPSFANVHQYPDMGLVTKAWYMDKAPYQYCIFLDYDTYVTASLQPVFDTLERGKFDLGVVMDEGYMNVTQFFTNTPDCYPKYNTGMVAFERNDKTANFFTTMRNRYTDLQDRGIGLGDEVAFAQALFECNDIRYVTLPPEYNCRFIFPAVLRGRAVVLHGRDGNLSAEKIADRINQNASALRVWADNRTLCKYEAGVGYVY